MFVDKYLTKIRNHLKHHYFYPIIISLQNIQGNIERKHYPISKTLEFFEHFFELILQ